MPKPLLILKLGGSVITYKNYSTGRLRTKRIKEIAQEVKQAFQKKKFNLILISGAGSYGHPIAKKCGIASGIKNKRQLRGFCEVKYIVNLLTTKLNKIFLDAGLNVFSCQASSLIIQNKNEVYFFNARPIRQLLRQGVIPMLSGDVVTDISWGGSICSGDTVALCLAKVFGTSKIFFASDVDGIFDQDPHRHKNAKLIPKIDRKNFDTAIKTIGESSYADVTGGMRGKILKLKEIMDKTSVLIFNGLKKNSVTKALSGKEIGTLINLT